MKTADEVASVALRELHEAWLAAELSGDIEAVLALCTPDVRWLAPGSGMLMGLEAGRRLLAATQIELQDTWPATCTSRSAGSWRTKRAGTKPVIGFPARRSCTSPGARISGSFGGKERNGEWRW